MSSSLTVLLCSLAACLGIAGSLRAAETAADASSRLLLERLEERQMSDVTIWLLDRIAADPAAAADLKAEVPFRRARALVAASRNETDATKRAKNLDDAQALIEEFLKTSPSGERAIEAYTQKGNLLIERGRGKVDNSP